MPQFKLDQSTKEGLFMLAVVIGAVALFLIGGLLFIFWFFDRDTLSLLLWMD